MRKAIAAGVMGALALGGCQKASPELPADMIDRAATCALVAAAEGRAAQPTGDLPLAVQGRVLHLPLLAGAASGSFDGDAANQVIQRQQALGETALKGKWQALIPQCAAAFPETKVAEPALPAKPIEAQLSCYMVADFMTTALRAQDRGVYGKPIDNYVTLKAALDPRIGASLGGLSAEALRKRRAEALAAGAKLGPPVAVLDLCIKRFG